MPTTLRVFLAPDSNLLVLGVPMPNGEPNAFLNLLIVVCLLWGIVKIPGLMRRYVTQSRPNPVGTVLRVVLVQQLTRGISRVLRRARRPLRPAGRAAGGEAGTGGANRPWPVRPGSGSGSRGRAGRQTRTARSGSGTARLSGPAPSAGGTGGGAAGLRRPVRPLHPGRSRCRSAFVVGVCWSSMLCCAAQAWARVARVVQLLCVPFSAQSTKSGLASDRSKLS